MSTNINTNFEYINELSDLELVEIFNNSVGVNAWGNARSQYINKIHNEFLKRNIDSSLIINRHTMSLAKRIKLQDGVIVFDTTKEIKHKTYTAKVNIGLQKNYDNTYYEKNEYIEYLQNYQSNLIKEEKIHLSAAVQEFELVYGNLVEKHLVLNFVNYPKFPLEINIFKKNINLLGKKMMEQFNQNRIMIEYPDETIVFEIDPKIDPKISL